MKKRFVLYILLGMLLIFAPACGGTKGLVLPERKTVRTAEYEKDEVHMATDSPLKLDILYDAWDSVQTKIAASVNDTPYTQGYAQISFVGENKNGSSFPVYLFLYEKDGGYVVEQPYAGIFEIGKDQYNAVLNVFGEQVTPTEAAAEESSATETVKE